MDGDIKNVFISHVHEDDGGLADLKQLIGKGGLTIRDSSINSSNPNDAKHPDYIKSQILAPQIQWASTLLVYITPKTKNSEWVNWEIEYAEKQGRGSLGYMHTAPTNAIFPRLWKSTPMMSVDGTAMVSWKRSWGKQTNGTCQRVNSVTHVQSSDTAAEREAAFICCGPGFWLCAESILWRLHAGDLQTENPKFRSHRGLGDGNRVKAAQT